MTDLSLDREKALGQIAAGWGRVASLAHPHCRCGKEYLPTCRHCEARPSQPCRYGYFDPKVLSAAGLADRHNRTTSLGDASNCPVHKRSTRNTA